MKLYRNAVILVIILGLLTGAYFLVKNKQGKISDPSSGSSNSLNVLNVDVNKITQVTVVNKDGTFAFEKKDKDWTITSPANLKIDKSKVGTIATNLSYLDADKVVEDSAKDLSVYGLDKPSTVTAKLSDGTVIELEIGSKTPTGDDYYAKKKEDNKVYTISTYTVETLVPGLMDILNKTLISFKPEDANSMQLDKAGKVVFAAQKTSGTNWSLTAPIDGNADASGINTVLTAASQLAVKEFVELNAPDMSKYGLDKPSYTLELGTATQKVKLLLGSEKVKGSVIYAKLADGKDVFTLDESAMNFLDKPLKEFMDVFAYLANIVDVDKVVVQIDGRTDTLEIQTGPESDKTKDKFTFNGKDVTALKNDKDDQLVRKYYQGIIGVTMDDVEIGATPTGNAEITFTYYLKKDPKVVKVEFIPKDQNYYYVVKNDKYSNMLVSRKKFYGADSVRDTYTNLVNAMNNVK